jgi:hypothetical protein
MVVTASRLQSGRALIYHHRPAAGITFNFSQFFCYIFCFFIFF